MAEENKLNGNTMEENEEKDGNFYTQILDMISQLIGIITSPVVKPITNFCCPQTHFNDEHGEYQGPPQSWFTSLFKSIEMSRKFCREVLENQITGAVIIFMIVLNAIAMGSEHHNQPEELTTFFTFTDPMFAGFFAIEVALKIYAYGFCNYIRDCLNLLDLVTVVIK